MTQPGIPLYQQIKGCESRIADLEARAAYLRRQGFDVQGTIPLLQDEARQLLHGKAYDSNPIAQRMRVGEQLENIVDDVFAPYKKVSLRWNKERREKYNEQVRHLDGIVPFGLYAYPAFHHWTTEGAMIYATSIGAALVGGIGYLSEKTEGHQSSVEEVTLLFAVIVACYGMASGLLVHGIFGGSLPRKLDGIKEYVQYVDKSLGRGE